MGLEQKSNPVVVYPAEQHGCPWAGCETKISGIDFQLRNLGMPDKIEGWLTSWWGGPGLVGQCPGCGKYVQYGFTERGSGRSFCSNRGLVAGQLVSHRPHCFPGL